MYVCEVAARSGTTFSPDGRWDCELSTSPLPNARRHTIFSVVDCESSLDYIIELPCGRMQPAVPEAYLEQVATMNYGMSSSAFLDNHQLRLPGMTVLLQPTT